MKEKQLINQEDITIGDKKYFISSIPAIPAQKMFLRAIGAFTSGDISKLPYDIIMELLTYAGAYNQSGAAVQFIDEDMVGMMVSDPMDLFEIEAAMIEKNFGFLADGRLTRLLERMGKAFTRQQSQG